MRLSALVSIVDAQVDQCVTKSANDVLHAGSNVSAWARGEEQAHGPRERLQLRMRFDEFQRFEANV